ncbi:hypothetical protein DXG03_009385 [Asterophora parasitica]|uniref:Protein kinase domain-containing protein n=1 Tax=Asterophora parasitica TaxID=117018 RepID=A0A9P7GBH4_9AGAR|nr:hypothetical protein DXG03_009385 [Asterophora parasitica]
MPLGRVKIACHAKSGQYAAIKIIPKVALNTRTSLNRLADETDHHQLSIEREIVVMKLLDHPNLLRLYDVWETSTELFLILEYVQGGELFEYLCEKGPLPVPEALDYFQQIIAGISYCHEFNISHRDLKPENILLDKESNIKIADFGMAVWSDNPMLRTCCGSPHYAAPEVFMGDVYCGSAADIWSCGVILFVLLAGKLPFDDEDVGALSEKVKIGAFEMPSDIDPSAQDLIRRMLTKPVDQRITMPEIMAHPFFTMIPPKIKYTSTPPLTGITKAIDGPTSIDRHLFANLRTLWNGTPEADIVEKLVKAEPTLEKSIYHLLDQYRAKHVENHRDDEAEIVRDRLERLERRKSRRAKKDLENALKDAAIRSSPSFLPPREDPPTPRRASGQPRPSIQLSDESLSRLIPVVQLEAPSSVALCTSTPPDWQSLTPVIVPQVQDEQVKAFYEQIAHNFNVLQATAIVAPNVDLLAGIMGNADTVWTRSAPSTPSTSAQITQSRHPETGVGEVHTGTRPLSVKRKARRPDSTPFGDTINKENVVVDEGGNILKRSSLKRGQGRRAGLGDRRVHIVEPTFKERTSKLVKRGRSSGSPAISDASSSPIPSAPFSLPPFSSSSPKRTWLVNIFNTHPAPLSLLSVGNVRTTRNECRRLLMAMNIRVVLENPEGLGVLKCRLEEVKEPTGVINVLKAVKFRVEFQAPEVCGEEGEEVLVMSLSLVHEKGSTETFKEVYRRLDQEWTLYDADAGTPVLGEVDMG